MGKTSQSGKKTTFASGERVIVQFRSALVDQREKLRYEKVSLA